MAAARRKHAVLVGAADTALALKGRGLILVENHSTPTNDLLWVNPNTGTAAVALADDMICIGPGGFRIFEAADKDGTIDLHVLSASAITVSAEIFDKIEVD